MNFDLFTWHQQKLFKSYYLYAISLGYSEISAGYAAMRMVI